MRRVITLFKTLLNLSFFGSHTMRWKTYLMSLVCLLGIVTTSIAAPCPGGAGIIGGKIFGDYNLNGIDDQVSAGFAGIEVQIFASDASGNSQLVATELTDAEGQYFFNNLTDGVRYRIEFTIPDSEFLFEGFLGANSQTSVQFATAPNCDIDLGLSNPNDFCVPNPMILVPCFINGDPLAAGSTSADGSAVVVFPFDAEGTEPKTTIATASQVGSLYGITTMSSEVTAFAAAFLKRHVGLGPLGLGGIYKITDADTDNATVSQFVDLQTLGVNLGSIPSNADRGLPINEVLPSNDPEAFIKIGKEGIGGLDLSDDESALWFVNLFNKTVYSLEIDSDGNPATAPTAADLQAFPLPNAGCTSGEFRPFAIRYYRDRIYVGGICDASNGTADDLEAMIYEMPVNSNSFTEVLRFDLNFTKGKALRSCDDERGWFPWIDELPEDCTGNGDYVYPTPLLSTMEFDIDGSLIMGFMDRTGNQLGYLNYGPTGNVADIKTTTGGDILRAARVNGIFVIESNGTAGNITTAGADNNEGPGGGEFYYEDVFTNNLPLALYPHNETAQGGVALAPGSGMVVTTALDPFGTTVNSGGVNFLSNTTGEARDPGYLLFSSGTQNSPTFGKANGLGAVTLSCGEAPLEIGNYIWIDTNNDGVQDPSELPLEGINVTLFDANGLELATIQTDANGQYVFNNDTPGLDILNENTDYTIVVGTGGQFNPNTSYLNGNYFLTLPNTGMGVNNDANDSDGTIALVGQFAGLPVAQITTGADGQNDHSFDFGFVFDPNPPVGEGMISGRAFKDCNNNGIREAGEPAFPNLEVRLTGSDNNNNNIDINTTTGVSGNYQFSPVPAGTYAVSFTVISNFSFVPQNQGSDTTLDSDANQNTGVTDLITIAPDDNITNIDVGLFSDIEPALSAFPEDLNLVCESEIPNPPTITSIDNCGNELLVTYEETMLGEACDLRITRTWTATDACGITSNHVQIISITDDEAPILSAGPADMTIECTNLPDPAVLTATDNCTQNIEVVYTQEVNGADCSQGIMRRWVATDDCGNSAVHTQMLMTSDDEAPVLSGAPEDMTIECTNLPDPAVLTATDNCTQNIEVVYTQEVNGTDCSQGIMRRWVATDDCGNSAVHTQMLMTSDDEAPVLSGAPEDMTIECADMPEPAILTATDNCTQNIEVVYTQEVNGTDCSQGIMRRWVATDDCGNSAVHEQMLMTSDDEAPVLSGAPEDMTIECADMPEPAILTATDNCTQNIEVVYTQEVNGTDCSQGIMRRWVATDDCGNSAVHEQMIMTQDDEAPVLSGIPDDTTINCLSIPAPANVMATDNCAISMDIVLEEVITNEGCETIIGRTWTATDDCGNSTVHTQTITATDDEAPVLSGAPQDMTLECSEMTMPPVLTATDNCTQNIEVIYSQEVNGTDCSQGIMRRWTATDACGNSTVHEQLIMTDDDQAPSFTAVPEDMTINCLDLPEVPTLTATDNCDPDVEVTYSMDMQEMGCASIIARTWTATDDCGNSTVYTQMISALDDSAPEFNAMPADITADCLDTPEVPEVTAYDNCDMDVDVFFDETTSGSNCDKTIDRKWTAMDNCGNSVVHTQTITIIDNEAPVITPSNPILVGIPNGGIVEVECNGPPAFGPEDVSVTDNCDENPEVIFQDYQVSQGICAEDGYLYVLTCGWTATDACGNTSTYIIDVHIVDNNAPVFTNVPQDMTIECVGEVPTIQTPSVSDDCTNNLFIEYHEEQEGTACSFVLRRIWSAADKCGNIGTAVQTITYGDVEGPAFTNLPADLTLECGAEIPVNEPNTDDNCGTATLDYLDIIKDGTQVCDDTYQVERIWSATDDCGNISTYVQTIDIEDSTAPTISFEDTDFVDGAVIEADCTNIPVFMAEDAIATDNCDNEVEVTLESMSMSGTCEQNGYFKMFNYIWTATDNCGNSSSLMITLLVTDLTNPVFDSVPADITVDCTSIPYPESLTATDNCGGDVEIAFEETTGAASCLGGNSIIRTWIAYDACGNTSQVVQNITIEDSTPPTLVGVPADIVLSCGESLPDGMNFNVTATDNCDLDVAVSLAIVESGADNCVSGGAAQIQYVYTATDDCGNTAQATLTISYEEDSIQPTISGLPDNMFIVCGDVIPTPADYMITATDNCDADVELTMDIETVGEGNCISGGPDVIKYSYTAIDNCGNMTQGAFTVFFEQDLVPPVLVNIPADQTINCDEPISDVGPTATDNCDTDVIVAFETELMSGDCAAGAEVVRTWIATDNCGNTAKATQIITISDTTAPVFAISAMPDITVECDMIPDFEPITATDACIGDVIALPEVLIHQEGACEGTGVSIIAWTASDACGNSAIITQKVTIQDTTAPAFDNQPDDITVECAAVPAAATMTAMDNCTTNVTIDFVETKVGQTCPNSYTLERVWIATDDCGNATTYTQQVTIQDTTAPTILDVPADITAECAAVPTATTPTANDNCSADTAISIEMTEDITDGDCTDSYTITRTWTATDECGNQAAATQQITVLDTTAPILSGLSSDITVECDAIPDAASISASDNCTSTEVIQIDLNESLESGSCTNNYTIIRTWTATDNCGNAASFTQTITVEDTTAPVFENTPSETITIDLTSETVPTAATLTATDACAANVTVTLEENGSFDACDEIIVRTWTATDECGNVSVFTQTITATRTIELTSMVTDDTCEKEEGSISILPTGGIAPYVFLWEDGQYTGTIFNLLPGDYSVTVTDAEGCSVETTNTVGAPNPEDCLLCGTTIGDFVWYDLNSNGIQDVNEPGVNGVIVQLITAGADGEFNTADDVIVDTDETNNLGLYEFNCVEPGTYIIQFHPISLPDNTLFTEQDAGDDDELDSDADGSTGQTDPFTLTEGIEEDLSFDAGLLYDCVNVTDGGEICCDQVLCGAGSFAETIGNVTPASGGFGPVEYIWMMTTNDIPFDINSVFWQVIPGATEASYNPGALYETTYFVRCARSLGCENYVGETDIIVIEVVSALDVDLNGPEQTCIGTSANFEAFPSTVALSYAWTLEGATPSTASTRSAEGITWDTPGLYTVTLVTTTNDCVDTSSMLVLVTDCAAAQFQFGSTTASIENEQDIRLHWEVTHENKEGVYTIEYSPDGEDFEVLDFIEASSNAQNTYSYVHDAARIGHNFYRVKYIHIEENFISFSGEVEVLLNIEQDEIRFFPNPFKDKIYLEMIEGREDIGQLEIVDVNGRILDQMEVSKDLIKMEIDLTEYPQGVYFVKVKFGLFRPTTYKMVKGFE